jgi:TRAP-type C4-dicarboxylate transport system permease small subunit
MNDNRKPSTSLLTRFLAASQKTLEFLCGVFTIIMVLLVFLQVIFRYVFFYPFSWSEEFSTYLFIWIVLLGAAVGIRKQEHLGISIMEYFPKKAATIIELGTNVIIIVFFLVVLFSSWKVAMVNMARRASSVDVSMGYIRMALPLMAFFSVVFGIELQFKLIRNWLAKKTDKQT